MQRKENGVLSELLLRILTRLGGRDLVYPLRLLYGRSFGMFVKRIARLRRVASSMRAALEVPPLPLRLQIETTDVCNFKCRMCTREVIEGMNTKMMSLEQFQGIVEEISPYYLTLNGLGEPLIDKTIFEKLEFAHNRGIMTAMPTNGTYVRGEKLERLSQNLPDTLTFSIDGASKQSFEYVRVLGNFDQVITNYRAILQRRNQGKTRPNARVQVLCALQKANLHDYRPMYELKKSMPGIDSFSLVPVFDYDAEGHAFGGLIPTRQDVLYLHAEIDKEIAGAADSEEAEFYRNWKSTASVWLDHDPSSPTTLCGNSCLVPWYSTYIDTKGRVYPCCYLTNSPHVMGNINEEPFANIWQGERYRSFRHSLVHDRKDLVGCRTCARNDDRRLQQLEHFKIFL
jgi:radical SAM protein with 4Fe4S-binding SPASM domain